MILEPMTVRDEALVAQFCGEEPRVHPNGFIQVNLDEFHNRRLHMWHPDVPTQGINTIHDHVFNMNSEVVVGTMTNATYWWSKDILHDQFNSHELWRVGYEPKSFEAKLYPTGQFGWPELDKIEKVMAGQSYYLPSGVYHVADNSPVCATVMERGHKNLLNSHVMFPRLELPQEFSRATAMNSRDMWTLIWEVLDA